MNFLKTKFNPKGIKQLNVYYLPTQKSFPTSNLVLSHPRVLNLNIRIVFRTNLQDDFTRL